MIVKTGGFWLEMLVYNPKTRYTMIYMEFLGPYKQVLKKPGKPIDW